VWETCAVLQPAAVLAAKLPFYLASLVSSVKDAANGGNLSLKYVGPAKTPKK